MCAEIALSQSKQVRLARAQRAGGAADVRPVQRSPRAAATSTGAFRVLLLRTTSKVPR